MESVEEKTDYEKRVDKVLVNKKYWSYWEVSERLKAMGVKRGFTTENIRTVFKRRMTENLLILQAAEEVIKIRKQIHILRPIALMSKALIIEEYENIKVLTAAEEVIKIRQQVLIKDPISLRTKEGIIEEYNSKLNALKATLLD